MQQELQAYDHFAFPVGGREKDQRCSSVHFLSVRSQPRQWRCPQLGGAFSYQLTQFIDLLPDMTRCWSPR